MKDNSVKTVTSAGPVLSLRLHGLGPDGNWPGLEDRARDTAVLLEEIGCFEQDQWSPAHVLEPQLIKRAPK